MCSQIGAQDNLQLTGHGPIQIRNQFPLSLQFFSFYADDAFTLKKNDFRISLNYHHSNTFAQSAEVLRHLSDSNDRIDISADFLKLSDGADRNSNRFLFDSAIGRTTLNFKYGVFDQLTLELDIPFIVYHGGFLDKPIEIIHQISGFPFASRSMLKTNTSQMFLSGSQGELFYNADNLGGPGLGDIVLIAKGQIYKSYITGFALSTRIAMKLPTGNFNYLRGSGSFDFGIDLTATKKLGNNIISTNLFGIIPGQWKLMPEAQINPSYSWILVYEYLWGKRLSLILQNQVLSSNFGQEFHSEISKTVFEWTAGLKYDIGNRFGFTFSITENYIHHNNTADFGFRVGISRGF